MRLYKGKNTVLYTKEKIREEEGEFALPRRKRVDDEYCTKEKTREEEKYIKEKSREEEECASPKRNREDEEYLYQIEDERRRHIY
jgi:hypothetical protein